VYSEMTRPRFVLMSNNGNVLEHLKKHDAVFKQYMLNYIMMLLLLEQKQVLWVRELVSLMSKGVVVLCTYICYFR